MSDATIEEHKASGLAWGIAGLLALGLTGVVLAVLPHVANWWRTGDVNYVAEGDQLLYMGWSRETLFHGVPRMSDAVHRVAGPMMHPWTLFVPPALVAHALGLDMRWLPIGWRMLGGVGLSLGLYAALRPWSRDRRMALGVAALLVADAGFLSGQPLIRELDILRSLLNGTRAYFSGVAIILPHFRVVPPSLPLPFLLAHHGLMAHARLTGSRASMVGGAITFGILFHIYFYFWSATLVGLVLAFLVDPRGRRLYASVLAGGLVIGLPAVVMGMIVKGNTPPDWLHRADKFVRIGRFEELLIPKTTIAFWLLATPWVFLRRREVSYLWSCAGASLALMNHQVVTRLQIENFHWIMSAGPTVYLLLAVLIAPALYERARERRWGVVLVAIVLAQGGLGLGLRWLEATRTTQTERWGRVYRELKVDGVPGSVPEGAVLAGDPDGVLLLGAYREVYPLSSKYDELSSLVTNAEFDERILLNLYLLGLDRDAVHGEVNRRVGRLNWEPGASRSPEQARAQLDRRLALIKVIWDDPSAALARYGVTHVLLRSDAAPFSREGLKARAVFQGRHWQVWELTSPRPAIRFRSRSTLASSHSPSAGSRTGWRGCNGRG
ncbi:MAG: hypothetical protein NVSMB9_19360 [Isosphaeraceae bacterium]